LRIRKFEEMERLVCSASDGAVLAVAGPDSFQSGRILDRAVARFRDQGYEISRFDAKELSIGDIGRMLTEGSLFAGGRLLVISRVHALGRRSFSELLEVLKRGITGAAVLLVSEKSPRNSSILRKLEKPASFYTCYEPFESDMSRWIAMLTREEGISLDGEAKRLLADYAGRNLAKLSGAVTTLSLYHGKGMKINAEGVTKVLFGPGDVDVFRFGESVLTGRRGDALDCAARLLDMGEDPLSLLNYLYGAWRKVALAAGIMAGGGGRNDVSAGTGARYKNLDRLMAKAGKLRADDVARVSKAFAMADMELKSGREDLVVFADLVFALTRRDP